MSLNAAIAMPSACAAMLGRDLLSEASRIFRPSPGCAQQIAARHAGLVEIERRRGRRAQPHLVFRAPRRETRRILLHDQRRDRAARIVDLAPLAEHQQQVGGVAAGDEGLAAVDDDVVAVRREARRHARGVGARIRLGDGERAQPARGDARQQPLLLLLAAEIDQRLHAVEVGGVDDAGGGAGLRDDLHHGQIELVARRAAAIGLRHEQPVEPERRSAPRHSVQGNSPLLSKPAALGAITSSATRRTASRIACSSGSHARLRSS